MSLMGLLLLVVATLAAYLVQTKWRLLCVSWRFTGPWAIPLIGSPQLIAKIRPEYLFLVISETRRKYGRSFRLWLGPQLWIFLHSPEETRAALNDATLLKADTFDQLKPLIGRGLLVSHGKYWDRHRRALGPAFHPKVLNSFVDSIVQHADYLVEKLSHIEGHPVEVGSLVFPCIFDIIVDTSMGKRLNTQHDAENIYVQALHSVSLILFKRMVNPFMAMDFIFRWTPWHGRLQSALTIIHDLMDKVIAERAEALHSGVKDNDMDDNDGDHDRDDDDDHENFRKRPQIFLDILLTTKIDGTPLTWQQIRDEVNTFVLAGVDTTAAAMDFVLYALGRYPEAQEQLVAELLDTPMDDIGQLTYLDMFVKECLRLYTVVPLTGRQTTGETRIGDTVHCAGVTLWIDMYGLAHDDALFDEPYTFRPERFSRENQRRLPPFSYIPFSGGPHICIGRKYALLIIKILIVRILQRYTVELQRHDEQLILMAQMVLKSFNGINVIFKRRQQR